MTTKASANDTPGNMRMPNALSSDTINAATNVPDDAAETADDDNDQRFDDDRKVHCVAGGFARQSQRAAERGEKDAEREHAGEQPARIDAERGRHFAIERRRPHQHAPARAAEQKPERAEHNGRQRDQQEIVARERSAEQRNGALEARRARTEQLVGPPDNQHQILDHQRDAEGREQLEQLRLVVDATQQRHLDERAERGDGEASHERRRPEADRAARALDAAVGDISAEHIEGAVREIDDARHAENDRQSAGDEKQRAGAGEAGDELDEVEGQERSGGARKCGWGAALTPAISRKRERGLKAP